MRSKGVQNEFKRGSKGVQNGFTTDSKRVQNGNRFPLSCQFKAKRNLCANLRLSVTIKYFWVSRYIIMTTTKIFQEFRENRRRHSILGQSTKVNKHSADLHHAPLRFENGNHHPECWSPSVVSGKELRGSLRARATSRSPSARSSSAEVAPVATNWSSSGCVLTSSWPYSATRPYHVSLKLKFQPFQAHEAASLVKERSSRTKERESSSNTNLAMKAMP